MGSIRSTLTRLYGDFRQRYCGSIFFPHETMYRLTVGSRMQGYCTHCGTRMVIKVRLGPGAEPCPGIDD